MMYLLAWLLIGFVLGGATAQCANYSNVPEDHMAVWWVIVILMAFFWPFFVSVWVGMIAVEMVKRVKL